MRRIKQTDLIQSIELTDQFHPFGELVRAITSSQLIEKMG